MAPSALVIRTPVPTVLVVEDDPANRVLLTTLLERSGYRAVTAPDGPSGLAAAFDLAPDALLLDVGLPGMDGLEICRRLRADPRTVALPIVLLTGRTSVEDVVAGLDAGADDFLAKPFHESELLARLRSARRLALVMAEMEEAQGVIAALANAVEAKDSLTEDHCQRLAGLTHLLATDAGLEGSDLKGAVFGAILHDIGKIGVSDSILMKPGPLTDEEWVEMRRHPIIGEEICRPLASSRKLRRSSAITTSAGTAWVIPIGARIVGLVDAFDSMVNDRPYRLSGTLDAAMAELASEVGHQFDPDLAERFTHILEREGIDGTDERLRIDSRAALRAVRNGALLRAILVPAGYDLTIAVSLAEARASLLERTPAIVLLDRHLPDGDGLDLARDLQASRETAAIPILLVSASVLPIDRTAAKEAGCAGFIDKPVRVDALLADVARHLAAAAELAARAGDPEEPGEAR